MFTVFVAPLSEIAESPPDHTYSYTSRKPVAIVLQATLTEGTDNTVEELLSLKHENNELKAKVKDMEDQFEDKKSLLRETFVATVMKDDASVRKYTGICSKDQLSGLYDIAKEINGLYYCRLVWYS